MLKRSRILLVQENIQSARSTRALLEETGYLVDWRPALTPSMLEADSPSDAVLFDLHFPGEEELASLHCLRADPRWSTVPKLVVASLLDRDTLLLLRRMQADEVVAKPISAQELLLRVQALLRTASLQQPVDGHKPARRLHSDSIDDLAHLAAECSSPDAVEAILIRTLRSLRREIPFDVGYVCVEAAPERYSLVAQMGDEDCHPPRWYELGNRYTGWIALHKRSLMIADMGKDGRVKLLKEERAANSRILSFFGVPLICEEHVVGTLEVGSHRAGAWSERSMEAVEVAAQIACSVLSSPELRHGLSVEVSRRSPAEADQPPAAAIVCRSPAMQQVLRVASRIRESPVPVLITGESGSGKDVMARYLHQAAARRQHPFVAVLCAAVPETFQVREMFGIDKGVAPGVEGRMGRFEECGGGTLFLDEVGRMPLSLQARLLRVLEERTFSRIGSSQSRGFAGRVVAATGMDLHAAMAAGHFLPELYHRLAVVELRIPALRLRREDIAPLAQHFAERFSLEHTLPLRRFSARMLQELEQRLWPGNVRELSNAVERSLLLDDDRELLARNPAEEPGALVARPGSDLLGQMMEEQWSVPDLQLHYARYVYERVGRNKARACRALRINYRTLCHYLESESAALPATGSVH